MHLSWQEKTDIADKLYSTPGGRKSDKEVAADLADFTQKAFGESPAVSSLESSLGRCFNRPPYAFGYETLRRLRGFLKFKLPAAEFQQAFPPGHPLNASKAEADSSRRSPPRDGWKLEAEEFARRYFVALGKAVKVRTRHTEVAVDVLLEQENALFRRAWDMLSKEAQGAFSTVEIDADGGLNAISQFEVYVNARAMDRAWTVHAAYVVNKGSTEEEPIVMCAVEVRSLQFLPSIAKNLSDVKLAQLTHGKSSLKATLSQLHEFVKPYGKLAVKNLMKTRLFYLFLPGGTLTVRYFCNLPFDPYAKIRDEKMTNFEELSHHMLLRVELVREKRNSAYKIKGIHWHTSSP